MEKIIKLYDEKRKNIFPILILILIALFIIPIATKNRVKLGNEYIEKDDVALYIKKYHQLPSNYITHYGMETAASHSADISNKIIGDDTHWNTGQFSDYNIDSTVQLNECDIKDSSYNLISKRGSLRLVYTVNVRNVRVFYTSDHYASFQEITTFQLQLTRNIFLILFTIYALGFSTLLICTHHYKKNIVLNELKED